MQPISFLVPLTFGTQPSARMSLSKRWSSHSAQIGHSSGVHAAEMASSDTEPALSVASKCTERQVPTWALGHSRVSPTFQAPAFKNHYSNLRWYFLLSMLPFTLAHPLSPPPFVISVRRQAQLFLAPSSGHSNCCQPPSPG